MNKKVKITIVTILIITIFFIIGNNVYAEENKTNQSVESNANNQIESENKTEDESSNTSNTQNSNQNTTPTSTKPKSKNANLSNLGIKPNDFSGFKSGTTTYNVTVPQDVEEVEVYATAQSSSAKISGTGKKQLEDGKNTVSVVVTAEDGTTKTYTINITKEDDENTENVENTSSGNGLASLKIGDLKLSPEFSTNIYEYETTYIGEGEKLEIEAKATDPYYVVDITGNNKLEEGENIITILVSDPDGNNIATYQVVVNKKLVDEEAIAREQEELRKKQEQNKILIAASISLAIIVFLIIIFLIVKHIKNKKIEEDEYYNDFEEEVYDEQNEDLNTQQEDDDKYEEYDDEKPKRQKHKGKRFK